MSDAPLVELPQGVTMAEVQEHPEGPLGWLRDHDPERATRLVAEAIAAGADEVRLTFVPAGGLVRGPSSDVDLTE